jgi:gliding motility-associated-like protein
MPRRWTIAGLLLVAAASLLQAQTTIKGPTEVCGDCHEFWRDSTSGTILTWNIQDPQGVTIQVQAHPLVICFDSTYAYGPYVLTIFNQNGQFISHTVYYYPPNPVAVFQQGGAYCEVPGSPCPQVCAGTEIRYGMEYPGQITIAIEVIGGTLLEQEDYSFTILWDQPGQGQVFLRPDHDCLLEASLCVEILARPVARIGRDGLPVTGTVSLCAGAELYLQDLSQPAAQPFWSVSDGRVSQSLAPVFRFDLPGDYTVTLVESGGCICSDTTRIAVRVEAATVPTLDCIGTVCPGQRVTYRSTPGCAYVWALSGGQVLAGGGPGEDSISVQWQSGPEGLITLEAPGCAGVCAEPVTFRIPVLDGTATVQGPASVCAGTEVIYYIIPYQGTEYTWTVSPGASILEGQGSNQIRVAWPNSPAITTGWVEVLYDHCTQGCAGQARLDVHLSAPFHVRGPLLGCPGAALLFEAFRGSQPLACTWEVRDAANQVVSTQGSPSATFDYTALHGSGNFTVTATQTDPAQSCNRTYRWSFRVADPLPTPDGIEGPTLICPGQPYRYNGQSSHPGYGLEWTITNGGGQTMSGLDQILVHWTPGGEPWRLAMRHRLRAFPNCVSDPVLLQAGTLGALSIQGPIRACPGEWVTYSAPPGVAASDLSWSAVPPSAGIWRPGALPGSVDMRWLRPGPAAVEVTACGITVSLAIAVDAPPDPGITGPAGVCQGGVAFLQADPGLVQYGWYDPAGNLISDQSGVGLGPGTWVLGVANDLGCTDTSAFTLPAWPAPEISLTSPDPHGFCSANGDPGPILYTISGPGGYTLAWYRDNVLIPGASGVSLQANLTGIYHVVVTDANGCTGGSNPISVYEYCGGGGGVIIGNGDVNATPCPELDYILSPGTFCNERQYTATSSGGPIQNGFWLIYDVSQSPYPQFFQNSVTYTYPKAGYYTVYFSGTIDGANCDLAFIDTIPVSADFLAEPVCAGEAMLFLDKSTFLPAHGISSWLWDFGDPAAGAGNQSDLPDPTHTFTQSGTFTVSLTVQSSLGCTSRMIRQVLVRDAPQLQIQGPTTVCAGASASWEGLSDRSMISWTWDFGDPPSGPANQSALQQASHTYLLAGAYPLHLSGTDIYGCSGEETLSLQVQPNTLSGQIQYLSPLCTGDSTVLHYDGNGTVLTWSHGPVGNDPVVGEAGVYALTVSDPSGCLFTPDPALVQMVPSPEGLIRALELNEYGVVAAIHYQFYQTCQGLPVRLGLELAGNYQVLWSNGETNQTLLFSDDRGNPLPVGTHTFTVTLTDPLTGCVSTIGPMTVEVRPLPAKPQIAFQGPAPHCAFSGQIIQVLGPLGGLSYQWSSGPIGTQIGAFGAGTYTVRAVDAYGCKRESDPLEVAEAPSTLLAPDGCLRACRPDTLCIGTPPWLQSWQWLLDGQPLPAPQGQQASIPIDQSGRYSLVLTHQNGCQAESEGVYMTLFDGISRFGGQVWFDVNDNGLLDGPDTLVGGVNVVLTGPGGTVWFSTSQGAQGYGFEDIPGLGAFRIGVDTSSLPAGWTLVWPDSVHTITYCEEEVAVHFLLRFQCLAVQTDTTLQVCPGGSLIYAGDTLWAGMSATYTLQTVQGCDSLVTVTVGAYPAIPFTVAADSSCASQATGQIRLDPGSGVILEGSLNGGPWRQDLRWQTLDPGLYTLRIRDDRGCDSLVSVAVDAWPEFSFTVEADTSCPSQATGQIQLLPGPGVILEGSLNGGPWQQDLWWDDLVPGPYTLRIRDEQGCEQQTGLTVPAWTEPRFSLTGGMLGCDDPGVPVAVQWQSGQDLLTGWRWQDGSTDSVFLALQPGLVHLSADWLCGTVSRSVSITEAPDAQRPASFFYVPNVFSPDNNGINDVFRPLPAQGVVVEEYRFEVFDRWGNLMYRSEDPQQGWDGVMREQVAGQQVLVWWLQARVRFCRGPVDLLLKGDVTLMIGE